VIFVISIVAIVSDCLKKIPYWSYVQMKSIRIIKIREMPCFVGILPTCFFYKSYILSADYPLWSFLNRGGASLKGIFFLFHGR
jgi:hypothetical protein